MTSHDIGRPRPTNLSEQPRSKYILPKYTARVGWFEWIVFQNVCQINTLEGEVRIGEAFVNRSEGFLALQDTLFV